MRLGKQTDPDRFRCNRCQHVWEQQPRPQGPGRGYISAADPCPACGSLYMTWLNWRAD